MRSLRNVASAEDGKPTRDSYVFGLLCGLAYIYMVMAWGGFVFVLNMIGLHAAALVAIGRYSSSLHRAYTLFFVVGTLGAIRVPPVGMNPLKSMEQLAPLLVFLGFQVLSRSPALSLDASIKFACMPDECRMDFARVCAACRCWRSSHRPSASTG